MIVAGMVFKSAIRNRRPASLAGRLRHFSDRPLARLALRRFIIQSAIKEEAVPPVYAREDLLAARFRVARVLPYQTAHAPFVSNLLLAVVSGLLMIFSATLGVFTAGFAGLLALTIKRFGGWAILAAPALWAASEWLRLQISGVGWNALGYSQAFQPSVIAIARFGGVYVISALLVAASTALVFGVIYFERRRRVVVP